MSFLAETLAVSNRRAKALLDERAVTVNGRRVWMPKHAIAPGDMITVSTSGTAGQPPPAIKALYRDDVLMIVNKPPGMLSVGTKSCEAVLRAQCGSEEIRAVHRLDRDTSGCLIVALDQDIFTKMTALFRQRAVTKHYRLIVHGKFSHKARTLNTPIDGQNAVTHIRVQATANNVSYLNARIVTGRTHQIRKHLAGIHHPLVGDRQYFSTQSRQPRFRAVPRQMLHAYSVSFPHPCSGKPVEATAPLPGDFRDSLSAFGLRSK